MTLVQHRAVFTAPGEVEAGGVRYTAERFLIATGARTEAPPIEGLADAGYLTFREAIDLETLPESIFILGGGPVGCEFASLFSYLRLEGRTSPTTTSVSVSREEPEAGDLLGEELERRGVNAAHSGTACRARQAGGGRKSG